MTKKVLLLAALLTTTTAVTAFADDYPINYDKSTDVTYVGRSLNSVSVDGISVDVPDNTKLYNNVTDEKLTVRAGQVVTPSVSFSGLWMNAYVYIDYDGNKNFDVQEPNTDGTLNEDNELVSYSYYVIGGVRKNSAGETLANGNNISLPTFVVPASLAPGTYKMRFKVDWCSIDPGGSTVSGNDIVKNGGAILDIDCPSKVKYRCSTFLLTPQEWYEERGFVPNVCFPCATLQDPDSGKIAIYYGCADTYVGLAFTDVDTVVDYIKANSRVTESDTEEGRR